MKLFEETHLLCLLIIFTIQSTCCFTQEFKCNSTGRTCDAILDYIPPKTTTFEEIKNLFSISNLISFRGANNFPPHYPRNSTISSGTKIKIPFRCTCTNGTGLSRGQPLYKVSTNDSLYGIASEVFAGLVTYEQLQIVNNISDPVLLKVGQKLWVPLPCSCDDVDGRVVVHYGLVVESGSSLGGIAQDYNVSQGVLMVLNNLVDPNSLIAGSILDIPLRACSSIISNTSLDYPLLLPSKSYTLTATNCIICNCSAENNWKLKCAPSLMNSSCYPIQCEGDETLYIGQTTSLGCNHTTTCAYAGYTKRKILTTLALESICPDSNDSSLLVSSNGIAVWERITDFSISTYLLGLLFLFMSAGDNVPV